MAIRKFLVLSDRNRRQILEAYMIFGGIPYYWSLLQRGASLTQEIDRLLFSEDGDLFDEFDMLYASLFKKPEPYVRVIALLAGRKSGMTRKELIAAGRFEDNGRFTDVLKDLEWCGFIRSYAMMGKRVKDEVFQLMDHYTLFYYTFIHHQRHGKNFWQAMRGKPQYNTWCGLAFERACLWHIDQIKQKLGIAGILTNEYAWQVSPANSALGKGAQIDLLIDRSDGIIDICEVKYAKDRFAITQDYQKELEEKTAVFVQTTKTRSAVHTVMITTEGIIYNMYASEVQGEIRLDDLFA